MDDFKLYSVRVERVFTDTVDVFAKSEDEAISLAKCEHVVFDYDDYYAHKDYFEIESSSKISRHDKIAQNVKRLPIRQKIELHNAYCDFMAWENCKIHKMNELAKFLEKMTPIEVIERAYKVDLEHPYWFLYADNEHELGRIYSCYEWELEREVINQYFDEIVLDIEDGNTFGLDFIKELIEG